MRLLPFTLSLLLLSTFPTFAASDPPSYSPSTSNPEEATEQAVEETSFEIYGYLKLDTSWDEGPVNVGNFARWTESPSKVQDGGQFNITARQSRIGLKILAPPTEDFKLYGKVEVDFYGGGGENKNLILLRKAYMSMEWVESGWTVLAGQTSDLFSPLNPSTLNYPVAWWAGNMGYRHPQIRFTKNFETTHSKSEVAFALSRTVGDDFLNSDPGDSGSDSEMPAVQFRWGQRWAYEDGPNLSLGFSGHYGRENLRELSEDLPDEEVDSWSMGLDLKVLISPKVTLKSEIWAGENLDDYFAGIGQGINRETGETIESTGGWFSLEFALERGWTLGFGAGLDDPYDDFLVEGSRSRNRTVWINGVRSFRRYLKAGVEVSHWSTEYVGLEDGDSVRVQGAVIYSF